MDTSNVQLNHNNSKECTDSYSVRIAKVITKKGYVELAHLLLSKSDHYSAIQAFLSIVKYFVMMTFIFLLTPAESAAVQEGLTSELKTNPFRYGFAGMIYAYLLMIIASIYFRKLARVVSKFDILHGNSRHNRAESDDILATVGFGVLYVALTYWLLDINVIYIIPLSLAVIIDGIIVLLQMSIDSNRMILHNVVGRIRDEHIIAEMALQLINTGKAMDEEFNIQLIYEDEKHVLFPETEPSEEDLQFLESIETSLKEFDNI